MSGTWIALRVPISTARSIAVTGGERPEAMHLTLAQLGRYLSAEQVRGVDRAVRHWGRATRPLSGRIVGIGRFDGEQLDPVWALPSVEGLREARDALIASLPVTPPSQYEWQPHITIAWVRKGEPLGESIPRAPITFDTVQLWSDGVASSYKLRSKR